MYSEALHYLFDTDERELYVWNDLSLLRLFLEYQLLFPLSAASVAVHYRPLLSEAANTKYLYGIGNINDYVAVVDRLINIMLDAEWRKGDMQQLGYKLADAYRVAGFFTGSNRGILRQQLAYFAQKYGVPDATKGIDNTSNGSPGAERVREVIQTLAKTYGDDLLTNRNKAIHLVVELRKLITTEQDLVSKWLMLDIVTLAIGMHQIRPEELA